MRGRKTHRRIFGKFLLQCGSVLGLLVALSGQIFAAKIASIHAVGNRRYSEAQIVAASGLQLGQAFDAGALQAAVQRLAQGMDGAVLAQEAALLVGRSYSGVQCDAFGVETFVPVYRERGYLRVQFGKAVARAIGPASGGGPYDVEVTFPVKEGLVYNWNSVQWSGNQVVAANELDGLMGMSKGALANGKKIDAGWEQINQTYGKQGYVEARVRAEPAYDDASQAVTFRAAVSEGPQYHMGTFSVSGVPPEVARQIQSKWRLKPGAIYDSSYWHDFTAKDLPSLLASAGLRVTSVQMVPRVNRDQLTVDVSLVLK